MKLPKLKCCDLGKVMELEDSNNCDGEVDLCFVRASVIVCKRYLFQVDVLHAHVIV